MQAWLHLSIILLVSAVELLNVRVLTAANRVHSQTAYNLFPVYECFRSEC